MTGQPPMTEGGGMERAKQLATEMLKAACRDALIEQGAVIDE